MGLFKSKQTRKRPDGTTYTYTSPRWKYTFTHPKTGQRVTKSTGTADKKAARTLYLDAMRRAADEQAGHVTRYDEHLETPLKRHLDDWHADQTAKGNSRWHTHMLKQRATEVMNVAGFKLWRDITATGTRQALETIVSSRKLSTRSYNGYMSAAKQFCRWLVTNRRAPDNPLGHLSRKNQNADRRHVRRALAADELRWLLDVTRGEPVVYCLSGLGRAALYQLAAETGLRANEIRTLTWGCVQIDAAPLTVTVLAGYSKHRREDVLPLRPSTAQTLDAWRTQADDVGHDDRVFPQMTDKPAKMLEADMLAARARWIEDGGAALRAEREASDFLQRETDEGVADFHALRHTFISGLARAGVTPKVAMDLARHCDVNLTMRYYSHTVLGERATALDALPDLSRPSDTATKAKAG